MANAMVTGLERAVASKGKPGSKAQLDGGSASATSGAWPMPSQRKAMIGTSPNSMTSGMANLSPSGAQMKLLKKPGYSFKNGTVYDQKNQPYNSLGQPGKGLLS